MVKLGIILLALILIACDPGMYQMLHRTIEDPRVVTPLVRSFIESNTIFISWGHDEGTDEFILERARDNPFLHFEIIYRGTSLSFVDRGVESNARYIYRLSKRRGRKIFGPSPGAFGVSSVVVSDGYRNSTMAQAVRLESMDRIGNIYFFRSHCGLEISDTDWFYIDIPAQRQAIITVFDFESPPGSTRSHFRYYVYTRRENPVVHDSHFYIENNGLATRRFFFKLFPARQEFVPAGTPGGNIVQYRVRLLGIVP